MTTFNNPIRTLFSKKNTAPTTEKELLLATVSYHATPTANREPIRILLSEHAYVEAGISEGRPEALKNGLHHITSGHYIDSHMNEAQHDSQIEQLRLQREDIRSKKNEPEGILTNLLHNIIPALIQK
ncbi:MAG: hypothetical protein IPO63_17650 [Bacteroidetes bacterium]|nr:hypothetical protein [Bacteroidota bacterium]